MATVSSVTTGYFPTAKEGFTTTLASTISSGATTVPLNSVAGFSNGEYVVMVVDPTDATKKQAFTGQVDTSGVQITNVVWTEGSNTSHTAGATVVDYETATHWALYRKGLLVAHNENGTIKNSAVSSADMISDGIIDEDHFTTSTAQGWFNLDDTPDTVTYNGNRSYDLVFNSNDLTDTVSNGMRMKLTRTVTPPTQCTDLESSSSQYWSKTSPAGTTFTDDFCVGAWIKLESYTTGTIIARFNGTSGWQFIVQSDGTLLLGGYNAGSTNYSRVTSYQSIPLNKWVHIAAQLDMSAFTATTTTSYIMIDGVNVPAYVERGGTNPTALVQAGDLTVGARSGGSVFFDGKIAQAWYSNAKITQATIQGYISQGMTGSETSIVSHFDFNGDGNDNNANANNLTANGGATATTVDSPFNATEYGIITANSFSTNTTLTVQVPEGYAIPTSGGVSAVAYSTQDCPYGFPRAKSRWQVIEKIKTGATKSTATVNTWYNTGANTGDFGAITIPVGAWIVTHYTQAFANSGTNGPVSVSSTLSTANNSATNPEFTALLANRATISGSVLIGGMMVKSAPLNLTAATTYYRNLRTIDSNNGQITLDNNTATNTESAIVCELAYV